MKLDQLDDPVYSRRESMIDILASWALDGHAINRDGLHAIRRYCEGELDLDGLRSELLELGNAPHVAISLVNRRALDLDPVDGDFDIPHLRKVHHRLFEDLGPWAGDQDRHDKDETYRVEDYKKEDPSRIIAARLHKDFYEATDQLRDPDLEGWWYFKPLSSLLLTMATRNKFREGSGRAHRTFLELLVKNTGRTAHWRNVRPQDYRKSMTHTQHTLVLLDAKQAVEDTIPVVRDLVSPPISGSQFIPDKPAPVADDPTAELLSAIRELNENVVRLTQAIQGEQ